MIRMREIVTEKATERVAVRKLTRMIPMAILLKIPMTEMKTQRTTLIMMAVKTAT